MDQKQISPSPEQAQPVTPLPQEFLPLDNTDILARIEGATEGADLKEKIIYWTCANGANGRGCGCCYGREGRGEGGTRANPVFFGRDKTKWLEPIQCDENGRTV